MKSYEEVAGVEYDELLGGHNDVTIYNVSLSSGASVSRGDLLCAESIGGVYSIASATDTNKILCIAASDFVADSIDAVTQAYFSGTFNREKITFGGGEVSIEPFEAELRKQNIMMTSMRN